MTQPDRNQAFRQARCPFCKPEFAMTRPMPDLPPYGLHLFDFSLQQILPIALLESLLDWMELRG